MFQQQKMTLLPARWHYGYNEDSQEKEDNPSLSPSHFPERGTIRKLPGFGSAAWNHTLLGSRWCQVLPNLVVVVVLSALKLREREWENERMRIMISNCEELLAGVDTWQRIDLIWFVEVDCEHLVDLYPDGCIAFFLDCSWFGSLGCSGMWFNVFH